MFSSSAVYNLKYEVLKYEGTNTLQCRMCEELVRDFDLLVRLTHRLQIQTTRENRACPINQMCNDFVGKLVVYGSQYCDLTWTPGRLKSPITRLFVQQIVQTDQPPHYWPFVLKNHRWPVDASHKEPVMRKAFLCHVIILPIFLCSTSGLLGL